MARLGWLVKSQHGSHRKLLHAASGRIVIVAFHDRIRRNAVRHVLRLAVISEEDFLREL
jgi:predicted RNA binding protein YcfA (HicA-like mRNA interferase family)